MWPEERLIVETDGHRVHGTRQAFERDRRRDRRLLLAGWRVVRFTWLQVVRDPNEVAATIVALVGPAGERRGWVLLTAKSLHIAHFFCRCCNPCCKSDHIYRGAGLPLDVKP